MAKKKSKRPNLSQETLERARAEMRGTPLDQSAMSPAVSASNGAAMTAAAVAAKKVKRAGTPLATRHIPTTEELIAEYNYVLKDLRYLFTLAGILLLAIIVAAIVLPRPTG
jgi:NADH:ubiquinone oxidoreductase subunit 6 (subunit J)